MNLKIYDLDNYEKDLGAQKTKSFFEKKLSDIDGLWLYREPEIRTESDDLPTFTIVSKKFGLIFIKIYQYIEEDIAEVNDKYWIINGSKFTNEFVRFRNYSHKIKSKLNDPINETTSELEASTYYIFPYIKTDSLFKKHKQKYDEYLYFSDFQEKFEFPKELNMQDRDYNILVNTIQSANIINKISNIYIQEPAKNIGEAIVLNNKKISKFDYEQMDASLTITDKAERIRGMAGCGKTVLLAIKAARLHKRFPEKKIAFIFYTKSLYSQAYNLIRRYYSLIADDEPNWDNLKVLHSWGGSTTGEGFYSYICKKGKLIPKKWKEIEFGDACKELLENQNITNIFDFILVDEAQDFPLEFFLLIEKVLSIPKKVVIAYDELQTTNDIHIPEFETLFGKKDNKPNIRLDSQHDYILKKSYRNTLDVLITAFSFGFGFYSNITQIIQDLATWDALGFYISGELKPNNNITVSRPKLNSPNDVTNFYKQENPIHCYIQKNQEEVVTEVAKKIKWLIEEQSVKYTDILVIDINTNKNKILNQIQSKLNELNIESHIPGLVSNAREFFQENKVTLSTPRHSKGNEVPIVFVLGCEYIYEKIKLPEQRQIRNFMFISITRSKGWVYLYAEGRVKSIFSREFENIQKNIPNILFTYPSEEKIKELAKIDFLLNNPKAKKIDETFKNLKENISQDLSVVKALIDLDPKFKEELKKIIGD